VTKKFGVDRIKSGDQETNVGLGFVPAGVPKLNCRNMDSTILGGAIADRFAGSSPINIVSVYGPESRTRVCRA
jgi:hypothetical protein